MTTEAIAGLVMSAAGLLGGAFAFLSKSGEVQSQRLHDAEAQLMEERLAEFHRRMDRADAGTSKMASMVNVVPVLQERVSALDARVSRLESA